jgi:hypothetical protein
MVEESKTDKSIFDKKPSDLQDSFVMEKRKEDQKVHWHPGSDFLMTLQ